MTLARLCLWMMGAALLGTGGVVAAQTGPAAPAAPAAAAKSSGFLLLTDKPYVGVRIYDRLQKKQDGKESKRHETQKFWRDSAGRVREEVERDGSRTVWTYVTDPAAKVQYSWNNEAKVAFVRKLGDPAPLREVRAIEAGETRKIATTIGGERVKGLASALPAKTIEGQETIGVRQVFYSDEEQKTVISTADRWTQPAYHVALEEDLTDQQYGHRTFHWKSFKTEEPKADLFMVPKGFTLKAQEVPDTDQFE